MLLMNLHLLWHKFSQVQNSIIATNLFFMTWSDEKHMAINNNKNTN